MSDPTVAQRHAGEADRLLELAGQAEYNAERTVTMALEARRAADTDEGAQQRAVAQAEGLYRRSSRLTARAQAHALTALAIRKTGDR